MIAVGKGGLGGSHILVHLRLVVDGGHLPCLLHLTIPHMPGRGGRREGGGREGGGREGRGERGREGGKRENRPLVSKCNLAH